MEGPQLRDLSEILRDEMLMRDKIAACLADGPKTIPEIAKILSRPQHEVTYWVMAMWRYGRLEEVGKANDEGYYEYSMKEGAK